MAKNRCTKIARFAAVAATVLLLAAAQPSNAQMGGAPREPKLDPATGEPYGAPSGCCCFPKADSDPDGRRICKSFTEFDCKAECAGLRDGRLPSGCAWTTGACPQ